NKGFLAPAPGPSRGLVSGAPHPRRDSPSRREMETSPPACPRRRFDNRPFPSYRCNTGHRPSELSNIAQGEELMRTLSGRSRPAVEQLEDRQLLSVSVLPHNINLKGAQHGNGVFTVRIISDTQAATDILKAASQTFTVGDVTLTPVRMRSVDLNGDGVNDLILKFRRHDLATLPAGQHTFKPSATATSPTSTTTTDPTSTTPTTTTTSEEGTFNLCQPGGGNNGNANGNDNDQGHGNGHAHKQHGNHGHSHNG